MTPDTVGGKTVAESLQRSLRRLAVATVVLYLALISGGLKVYLDGKGTVDALCAFRQDIERRALASQDFLEEHPSGLPKAGITPKLILEQQANYQRTITSLKGLECEPLVIPKKKENR